MGTTGYLRVRRPRAWLCLLLAVCLGHSLVAYAAGSESDQIAELQKKLDQSLKMIQELSQKVKDLESLVGQQPAGTAPATAAAPPAPAAVPSPAAAAPPAGPAAPVETASRLAQLEQTVAQMAANAWQRAEDTGMPMHGFADVGVGTHNAEFPQ
ncbi:MAG TPA: hypothetical protein VFK87_03385, partial [Steroidobacteraceae bacterium]|nr:hypothetical protein [Steroidobacteraceae bacterium]